MHLARVIAFGSRIRRIIDIAVTLLPEPDSPTMPSTSPAADAERDAVDGPDEPVLGAEGDVQVAHFEEGLAQATRTRGSRRP